jgi:hypothetical protein
MIQSPLTREKEQTLPVLLEQEDEGEKLVLYNDDINTF